MIVPWHLAGSLGVNLLIRTQTCHESRYLWNWHENKLTI